MASFFQYFWGSSYSKQFLRFALSKIDLLDTQALDLEKLDLALGKKNVFTFKDVGIKLQKLEHLLQLPPSFQIQEAKVLQLRLTVPIDILTSPITVEVDGVQVQLKFASEDDASTDKKSRRRKSPSSPQGDTKDVVPHAMDLAQSFLETRPLKEKAELQAKLEAEMNDLASSVASGSEDSSEDDYPLGVGQPVTLPQWLSNFAKGIVDRTQVSIRGVTFQFHVKVPLDQISTVPELVTFQLAIDDILVEGVAMGVQDVGTEGPDGSQTSTIVHKEGKRHVALRKIRACLITEANVFSTLSRTPSMPSSIATVSPVLSQRQSLSRETSNAASAPSLKDPLAESTDLAQSRDYRSVMDSEDAFDIPYDMGHMSEDTLDETARSDPSTPRALAPQTPPRGVPRAIPPLNPAQTTVHSPPEHWASLGQSTRSEPPAALLGHQDRVGSEADSASQTSDRSKGSSSPPREELERSQLFSHEDAESMYMSAFSNPAAASVRQSMPGSWDYYETPEAGSSSGSQPKSAVPPVSSSSAGAAQDDPVSHSVEATSVRPDDRQETSSKMSSPVDNLEEAIHHPETRSPVADEHGHEAIATPKGPTRLMKELISVSEISIYIPSNSNAALPATREEQGELGDLTSSQNRQRKLMATELPGDFSVHAAGSSATFAEQNRLLQGPESSDQTFEVEVAPLDVHFDLSTSFLLTIVASKILAAFQGGAEQPATKPTSLPSNDSVAAAKETKIIFEKISIYFLENLTGVADTGLFLFGNQSLVSDALLTSTLQNLKIGISASHCSTAASIELGKFRLGYANDDILSFDQRLQMRASINDAFPDAGADVSITINQTRDTTKCDIKTLPLHAKIDLQRIDETFSWFGGLSSFLNMSSSVASGTAPGTQSPTRSTKPKARGVRFDTPLRPDDMSAAAENKLNLRIGGFRLDLVGKDCNVSLDTTAVKLISRADTIGVGISKMQLSGPTLRQSMANPSIEVAFCNTRLEFHASPKDDDLERLLELITPSKVKFDENDDEIMVDTLLRQRRKGAVLCINVDTVETSVRNVAQLHYLPGLGDEISRLAAVAKYIPEDDRPGILTLGRVKKLEVDVEVGGKLGSVQGYVYDFEVAHITLPALIAIGVGSASVTRNHTEEILGPAVTPPGVMDPAPVIMMRMIPDAMEPVIKLRLRRLNVEYRVPTVMDILGLGEDTTPQEFEANLAASVANLGEHAHAAITGKPPSSPKRVDKGKSKESKPTKVDVALRDCTLGLNPLGLASKLVVVLSDAHVEASLSKGDGDKALSQLNKASLLLIDDISLLDSDRPPSRRRTSHNSTPQVSELCQRGFVDICYVSSARVHVKIVGDPTDGSKYVDVEVRDGLLVLETCADSTHTLITLSNALSPPTPPSREVKFKTSVVPVGDLLASISVDAFGNAEGTYDFDEDFGVPDDLADEGDHGFDLHDSAHSDPLAVESQYYNESILDDLGGPADSMMSDKTSAQETNDGVLLSNFSSQPETLDGEDDDLEIHDDYFGTESVILGTAHRWNSRDNKYDTANDAKLQQSPIAVRVRNVHVIWNLFDGYDWTHTRDTITKAVNEIETKATERQSRRERPRSASEEIVDNETVIGDFLFNSIYIGIPANRDPRELAQAINQHLNDNATETETITTGTTAMTVTPSRQGAASRTKKRLKLNRSKRHKIAFELKGIDVDFVTFPPGSGETQNSVDVRVKDLDIVDLVPTSTWKKFATYDEDAGEREMGASMIHVEILNVKPQPDLAATDIVLKVTCLPLRLHVDQDALDFITRFFEFKDDSVPKATSPSDIPFVQRAEINPIPIKLDFKPKRVDYSGLRSGRTTEFMNFIVLDEARLTLRHTIVYGVLGFDRLGKELNGIWMPDVQKNQLPGVLGGLAPVRSLVNVGSGFKDLVEIPIKEYRKDGRVVRSIGKGAAAFAKQTGTELVKLGAKLAVGTQNALQGAEGLLVSNPDQSELQTGWEPDEDSESEEKRQISLYADQPLGVVQGLRGAYSSLARDLSMARDAIIAVPGEVMESQNAQGAAKAVFRRAPTIVFRPLIGSTKAIGQTLLGATNTLDPQNRRRVDQKYKKH